jgi:hypothetical protein
LHGSWIYKITTRSIRYNFVIKFVSDFWRVDNVDFLLSYCITFSAPINCEHGKYYADKCDDQIFYQCAGGVLYINKCAGGTLWNQSVRSNTYKIYCLFLFISEILLYIPFRSNTELWLICILVIGLVLSDLYTSNHFAYISVLLVVFHMMNEG